MEGMNKKTNPKLYLGHNKPPIVTYPFTLTSSLLNTLPLSIEVPKKPYFMNHEKISGGQDDENKKTKFASSPSDERNPEIRSRSCISKQLDEAIEYELKYGRRVDTNMDLKKIRRTISNRLSAQRSRLKKDQYIKDMEKKVNDLQAIIATLSPRIEQEIHQQGILHMDNAVFRQKLDTYNDISNQRKVEFEEIKVELKRLKELAASGQQKQHKEKEEAWMPLGWDTELEQIMFLSLYPSAPPTLIMDPDQGCMDLDLNLNSNNTHLVKQSAQPSLININPAMGGIDQNHLNPNLTKTKLV